MAVKRDGTIGDVTVYLDDLVVKYRSEASRITPLKSAVKRVFSLTKGEQWRTFLIIDTNLDQTMVDFKLRSTGDDFSDHTFAAYRARINRAFKWYSSFLEDNEWEPFEKTKLAKGPVNQILDKGPYIRINNALRTSIDMAEYPFPFLTGGETRLRLPAKLTRRDAERLKKFIDALVVEGDNGDGNY